MCVTKPCAFIEFAANGCHQTTQIYKVWGPCVSPNPINIYGVGPMDVTKPHPCIRFGAMYVTKPYKFIRFGAMDVTKPYEFIRFGVMDVTKPYNFMRFGTNECHQAL